MTVRQTEKTTCDKYIELINTLKVGQIYRYIGDGEFEIVDLSKLVVSALDKSAFGGD